MLQPNGAMVEIKNPRPRPSGPRTPRAEASRCRTPGCIKYHDFFQWNGKYYCLECYETLRNAERAAMIEAEELEAEAEA